MGGELSQTEAVHPAAQDESKGNDHLLDGLDGGFQAYSPNYVPRCSMFFDEVVFDELLFYQLLFDKVNFDELLFDEDCFDKNFFDENCGHLSRVGGS